MTGRRKYTVEDDRLIGQSCPACQVPFTKGEQVTNVPLGPGNDPEEMLKARLGQSFSAVCVVVHYSCATGEGHPAGAEESETPDVETEEFVSEGEES